MKFVIAHIVALMVYLSTPALAHDDERQLSISVGDWPPFYNTYFESRPQASINESGQ